MTESEAHAVKIAMLQVRAENDCEANLDRLAPLLDEAGATGADLIVLPELYSLPFVPGRVDQSYFQHAEPLAGPSNELARTVSERHSTTVVSSFFERTDVSGVFHNSVAVFDGGRLVGTYRKSHLPFSHAFPEKHYFQPGRRPPLVVDSSTAGTLGVLICYERHYPELARSAALQGAAMLCIPVAAASPSMRGIYHAELRAHAIANGLYVIAPNRIGKEVDKEYFGGSVVFGPEGDQRGIAADSGKDELIWAEIDLADVERTRLDRPFLRDRRPELYEALSAQ